MESRWLLELQVIHDGSSVCIEAEFIRDLISGTDGNILFEMIRINMIRFLIIQKTRLF